MNYFERLIMSRSFFRRSDAAFLHAVSGLWGGESPKGNFVPLGSLGGLEPYEKVPGFLLLFVRKK